MVMLVLVSAVTLSPMVKVMGLRSCASTAVDLSEIFITGLEAPVKICKQEKLFYHHCIQGLVKTIRESTFGFRKKNFRNEKKKQEGPYLLLDGLCAFYIVSFAF